MSSSNPDLPKPKQLRIELGLVLLLKIVLLIGLWWLIFRWMDRPATKPDIAQHFALPTSQPVH